MKSSLPAFVLLALVLGLCSAAPNLTEVGNLTSLTLDVNKDELPSEDQNTSLLLMNGTAVDNETVTLLAVTGHNDTVGNSTAEKKKDEGNPVLNFLSKSWHALTDFTVGVVGKVMSVVEPDAASNVSNSTPLAVLNVNDSNLIVPKVGSNESSNNAIVGDTLAVVELPTTHNDNETAHLPNSTGL